MTGARARPTGTLGGSGGGDEGHHELPRRAVTDAIVIGSGPNGLVAANLLADRGWDVLVLEAASGPGGAVRSAELIEPGYVNDVCSAFYPLGAGSPVLSALDLEASGLRWRRAPLVLAHPTRDGPCPVLSTDLDVTAASLDEGAPGDGDAWRALYQRWLSVEPALLGAMFTPFPPLGAGARLAASMGPAELARFARFLLLPVRRLGEEQFRGSDARLLLAGAALHAGLAPEATLSGFFGWLMCSLGQQVGFPVPEGGAGALSAALVQRLEERGGRVECNAPVVRVLLRDGAAVGVRLSGGEELAATRAVLADVDAPRLYRSLVGAEHLPRGLAADLERFHRDDATVKVDWNLDSPVPWTASAARRSGTVHVAEGVDELTVTSSELARGLVPERPFLLVGQQSMTDTTRQPAGKETAWAYTHVPQAVRGDAGTGITGRWEHSDANRMADRMEERIEALAPGFRDRIRGRHIAVPPTFEEEDGNLVGGGLNGGTAQIHQQLIFRPTPGFGRPETFVRRLYLCSASAHPGGGVHGGPGANAARAALNGDRRRRLTAKIRRVERCSGPGRVGE